MKNWLNIMSKDIFLKKILVKSEDFKHFNAGAYIRNKYLWNNEKLSKKLFIIFEVDNIDDLSMKLIDTIKKGKV